MSYLSTPSNRNRIYSFTTFGFLMTSSTISYLSFPPIDVSSFTIPQSYHLTYRFPLFFGLRICICMRTYCVVFLWWSCLYLRYLWRWRRYHIKSFLYFLIRLLIPCFPSFLARCNVVQWGPGGGCEVVAYGGRLVLRGKGRRRGGKIREIRFVILATDGGRDVGYP